MAEIFYTDEFRKNLKALGKKYPHLKQDLKPVIEQLTADEIIGDKVTGIGATVFKTRIANSDLKKGKRAGYRLLYWLQTNEKTVLLTLYTKSERVNISANELKAIISSVFE